MQTFPNLLEQSPDADALSVRELTGQIKGVLEAEPTLQDVAVRGEISNFKAHGSGHLYFSLKDEFAQIRAVMWRGCVANLAFRPANGQRVVAHGRVEFYGPRGEVSFVCEELHFDGRGALYEAYEQLKADLEAEGLFAPERKKPLPILPRRIGLITSRTGAVAHDVVTILRRRWPFATIILIPAKVQGFDAAPDLMRALSWAEALGDLDVVIMGRGGGSTEDLWCFNDEDLARAVSEFPTPIVSAVGHETDVTILDWVADLRAPTPSAAAELVAPDIAGVRHALAQARRRMHDAVEGDVLLARARLDALCERPVLREPGAHLSQLRERVAGLKSRARDAFALRVRIERQGLSAQQAQLRALDPHRVLERGYAIISDAQSGQIVTSIEHARPGQLLQVKLGDGVFTVRREEN